MNIDNKILDDYKLFCIKILTESFRNYNSSEDQNPILTFLEISLRGIEERPRDIYVSDQFNAEGNETSINQISEGIKGGNDLHRYLSKGSIRLKNTDGLLAHWGIHHFHLGGHANEKYFVSRSNDLLFVFFTTSAAYFLGVWPHGNWSNNNVFEELHRNWPELIANFRMDGIDMGERQSSDQTELHRRSNHSLIHQTEDGTAYLPPGGGTTMGGKRLNTIQEYQKTIAYFRYDFDYIVEKISTLAPRAFELNNATLRYILPTYKRTDSYYLFEETGERIYFESINNG